MSSMYSMAVSFLPEMMDEASMQRFQHERYLQHARDLQMAEIKLK